MPHVIILMDGALDGMRGNATTGNLDSLKTCYHAVDALIDNSTLEVSTQAHEFCDKVSDFLLGDFSGYASGRGARVDVDDLITEGNGILNA